MSGYRTRSQPGLSRETGVDFPGCSCRPWGHPGSIPLRDQGEGVSHALVHMTVDKERGHRKCPWNRAAGAWREIYLCCTGITGSPFSRLNGEFVSEVRPQSRSPCSSPEVFKTNFPLLCKVRNTKVPNTALREQEQSPQKRVMRHAEER